MCAWATCWSSRTRCAGWHVRCGTSTRPTSSATRSWRAGSSTTSRGKTRPSRWRSCASGSGTSSSPSRRRAATCSTTSLRSRPASSPRTSTRRSSLSSTSSSPPSPPSTTPPSSLSGRARTPPSSRRATPRGCARCCSSTRRAPFGTPMASSLRRTSSSQGRQASAPASSASHCEGAAPSTRLCGACGADRRPTLGGGGCASSRSASPRCGCGACSRPSAACRRRRSTCCAARRLCGSRGSARSSAHACGGPTTTSTTRTPSAAGTRTAALATCDQSTTRLCAPPPTASPFTTAPSPPLRRAATTSRWPRSSTRWTGWATSRSRSSWRRCYRTWRRQGASFGAPSVWRFTHRCSRSCGRPSSRSKTASAGT
mmetsp:Transcript_40681/g.131718  ORF Transcript_40681/g.131718 Transcript_40681/m.131718 type:complete len:371 (+) Transcript_40681:1573-2685(+)